MTDDRPLLDARQHLWGQRINRRSAFKFIGAGGLSLLAIACGESEGPGGGVASEAPTQVAATDSAAGSPTSVASPVPSSIEKQQGGAISIGLDQEPPTMDPHASPSAITFTITATTGEALLYLTDARELEPWLAETWEVAPDGTSFTFGLRQDVVFQDDTPFNGEAVKWNYDRIVNPDFQAGAALGTLAGYNSTEVVDEFTVRISFENPAVPFQTYSASPFLVMLSPTATTEQSEQVNQTPVMSGPYRIEEYVAKDHVTLARWDGYTRRAPWADHDGPGYLDTITWRFIPEPGTRVTTVESGETQVATVIPSQDLLRLESSEDFQSLKQPWVGVPLLLMIVVDHAPTDDLLVRQALNYGLDRDALVQTIYQGTGEKAIGVLTAVMLDDPSLREYYAYDPDRSKQLLDEAGWIEGSDGVREKDGQRLELIFNTIDYGGGPPPVAEFIQGSLLQIGIDVQIKAQARPPFYEDNYACAAHLTSIFYRVGEYDALYPLFHSSNVGGNFNWSCIQDPEVDQLLEQGREIVDPNERKAHYLELEKKFHDLAVVVPLIDEYSVWVMRKNVGGLRFTGFTYPIVADMYLTG